MGDNRENTNLNNLHRGIIDAHVHEDVKDIRNADKQEGIAKKPVVLVLCKLVNLAAVYSN